MKITVYVIKRSSRSSLYLRWTDPRSGQIHERSARTTSKKEAEKRAAKLEADIESRQFTPDGRMAWDVFREFFEDDKLGSAESGTAACYRATLNRIESDLRPRRISDLTSGRISWWQSVMKKSGLSDSTVVKHLRHLRAILRWARAMDILIDLPVITMPRRAKYAKLMKGRPLTDEEFERLLEAVPQVVPESTVDNWRWFLKGLWWSGLRLNEALNLLWDQNQAISVVPGEPIKLLRISAAIDKGRQDRLTPIAPEFSSLLETVAKADRTGFVFPISGLRKGSCIQENGEWVSRIVSRIGEKAGIVVDERNGRSKFSSTHDLRRSFGVRWANRVLPQQLKVLMVQHGIEWVG